VTRYERDVIAQWPKLFLHGAHKVGMVATRKIRTADRAREQHVTYQRHAIHAAEEDHMARRMSGAVIDLHGFVAKLNRVAILQPPVGREGLRLAEAEAFALSRQLFNPESVFGVWSMDLYAVVIRERLCSAAVIQVPVREEHLVDAHFELSDRTDDPFDVAAWIDNDRTTRCLAHNDRTILLEWCHWDKGDLHGWATGACKNVHCNGRKLALP